MSLSATCPRADSRPVPALFVSHGAPLFALEPGSTGPALTRWAAGLTTPPRAVVVMSPHWMARGPAVMTGATPATWHDFGGFPEPLYRLNYPAPGAPDVAERVLALLAAAGLGGQGDARRPFDHGAWVPLMHLFPGADVPVVQVALPVGWGAREVFALGQALAPLRRDRVLVMGTGSMTHNLGEFFGGEREAAPYVVEFSRWVENAVARQDREALLDWRSRAPHAHRAHPTEDHFLPLFFTLGAAGWGSGAPANTDWISREVMYGMLAMDAFALS